MEKKCCATTWTGRVCSNMPKYEVRHGRWLCEYHINKFNKRRPGYYKKSKGKTSKTNGD